MCTRTHLTTDHVPGSAGNRGAIAMSPRPGARENMRLLSERYAWQLEARCRGFPISYFFPVPRSGRSADPKTVCGQCQVRRQCLEFALVMDEPHGIWGGLDRAERVKVAQTSTD